MSRVTLLSGVVGIEVVVAQSEVQSEAARHRPGVLNIETAISKVIFLRRRSVIGNYFKWVSIIEQDVDPPVYFVDV